MKFNDSNKPKRDLQRRFLMKKGWRAFPAFKRDGSSAHKWIWLHPNYRKPLSREEAVKFTRAGGI